MFSRSFDDSSWKPSTLRRARGSSRIEILTLLPASILQINVYFNTLKPIYPISFDFIQLTSFAGKSPLEMGQPPRKWLQFCEFSAT